MFRVFYAYISCLFHNNLLYLCMEINKIYFEDCLKTMAKMPGSFLDLTITSPPYDDLRTYHDKVKGLESEYNGYSFPFERIASELYRVTKKGGVVVWVVGDAVHKGGETLNSFRQALYFQDLGFKVHDTMIYEKNGSSFPARRDGNRYSQIFEYMFVFSKDVQPKTPKLICDKKNRWAGHTSFGQGTMRGKNGELIKRDIKPVPSFSPRNNIWKYNTGKGYTTKDDYAFDHPAMFPEKLVEDHIFSWSEEGDIVYDPMGGSGTTAKMAIMNGRKWVMSDFNKDYADIAQRRVKEAYDSISQQELF